MRNLKTLIGTVGVIAVAFAASNASASCLPGKTAATYGETGSIYIEARAGADLANVTGSWWQLGNYAAANDTPSTISSWFYFFEAGNPNSGTITNLLGDYANTGCPTGTLISVIEIPTTTGGARFAALTQVEENTPPNDFDYGAYGANAVMVDIPRPRATSSSRVGSSVNLTLVVDSAAAGAYGPSASSAIAGYEIVRASGQADPGRAATAWTSPVSAVAGAPTSIVADCSVATTDQFYATRVVFADGQRSKLVGASTRVNCNPALADPEKGFKVIDRKGAKSPTRQ